MAISNRITVVGSSNTDMVIKTTRLPAPGESILGGVFLMNPGGKGANQAVAAARLGGNVTLIAKTGDDIFGHQARQLFANENINTNYLFTDKGNPSGVALITVDEKGENCIVVAPGSNATLSIADIEHAADEIKGSEFVLMQLEIPLETVEFVASLAFRAGKKVILNPAPACKLPSNLMKMLHMITPNETEAELLCGIPITNLTSAEKAAASIHALGVQIVIITLGKRGALVYQNNLAAHIPAPVVTAMDTTAAGDVFNGALVTALAEGLALNKAVEFANKAAAISVTRMGAQSSAPYRKEIV
jgi:ribokinase